MIVGGESGAGAQADGGGVGPESSATSAEAAGVPFFFKQWGGVRKKRAGRELDGRTYDEMPPWGGAAVMSPEGRREAIARVDRQIAGI